MDNVSSQDHYQNMGIDSVEIMRRNFSIAEFVGFLKGNVIKYIFRYQMKDGLVDLKKAWVYLTWHIFTLERPSESVPKHIDQVLDDIINGRIGK
jgi:hypothetical protein